MIQCQTYQIIPSWLINRCIKFITLKFTFCDKVSSKALESILSNKFLTKPTNNKSKAYAYLVPPFLPHTLAQKGYFFLEKSV